MPSAAARQLAVLADLNMLVDVAAPPCYDAELVAQHGLADPSQALQQLAPPAAPDEETLKGHIHGLDLCGSASELVGSGAGTWVVGVRDQT